MSDPLDPREAFRTDSPHWGCMVAPVAEIRVPICPGCTALVEREGDLCPICRDDEERRFHP